MKSHCEHGARLILGQFLYILYSMVFESWLQVPQKKSQKKPSNILFLPIVSSLGRPEEPQVSHPPSPASYSHLFYVRIEPLR